MNVIVSLFLACLATLVLARPSSALSLAAPSAALDAEHTVSCQNESAGAFSTRSLPFPSPAHPTAAPADLGARAVGLNPSLDSRLFLLRKSALREAAAPAAHAGGLVLAAASWEQGVAAQALVLRL